MPDGNAVKPGDIVTTMSGQTVEILNTDAEGRLILCDALTYVEKYKPAAVVDIATLTGRHGDRARPRRHGTLRQQRFARARAARRRARTPGTAPGTCRCGTTTRSSSSRNFADIPNIGSRAGGSITAACFLSRFTKAYPWAHLDIAGTAWKSGAEKGATGRPVALLSHFLAEARGVTRIDFYRYAEDKLHFACRLAAKAYEKPERASWCTRPTAQVARATSTACCGPTSRLKFVPHCMAGAPVAAETPIILAASATTLPHHDVLLNLGDE